MSLELLRKIWNSSLKELTKGLISRIAPRGGVPENEWRRLERLPRYQPDKTVLFGREIRIVDAASYFYMFNEIINNQIYKFSAPNNHPYIIDCGSNIGLAIIYFKRMYPKAHLVGFEPDKKIFDALKHNIEAFGFDDVQLISKGVWKEKSTKQFFAEGADGGRIAVEGDGKLINIETERLRNYLQREVDFLKIDIEGAETETIADCQDVLRNVRHVFVEFHSFTSKEQSLGKILDILQSCGFRYHIHRVGVFSPHPFMKINVGNGIDNQLNIFASRLPV